MVWATGEVMATLLPMQAFSKVDLPAHERHETTPEALGNVADRHRADLRGDPGNGPGHPAGVEQGVQLVIAHALEGVELLDLIHVEHLS